MRFRVAAFAAVLGFFVVPYVVVQLTWRSGLGTMKATFAAIVIAVAVFFLWWGFRVDPVFVRRWTEAHRLRLTEANRKYVLDYLRTTRRFRTAGAVTGLLTSVAIGWGVNWMLLVLGGYLLGAIATEIRPQALTPRKEHAASLAPRQIGDYLPRYAIIGMRALPLSLFALIPVYVSVRDRLDHTSGPNSMAAFLGWALAAALVAVAVESIQRSIVRRPQPMVDQDVLDADEAIRSASIHALTGAGLGIIFGLLSGSLLRFTAAESPQPWQVALWILGVIASFGTYLPWLLFAVDQRWTVRRLRSKETSA